jgi:hypothetical protein
MSWVSGAMKVDSVQVSSTLRRATNAYMHWCPACEEMHMLPDTWVFDGNVESPTFSPSFKHLHRDDICHYTLSKGVLAYCDDSTHALKGKTIPLPSLPPEMCD